MRSTDTNASLSPCTSPIATTRLTPCQSYADVVLWPGRAADIASHATKERRLSVTFARPSREQRRRGLERRSGEAEPAPLPLSFPEEGAVPGRAVHVRAGYVADRLPGKLH